MVRGRGEGVLRTQKHLTAKQKVQEMGSPNEEEEDEMI
jgi:hypothetical protein